MKPNFVFLTQTSVNHQCEIFLTAIKGNLQSWVKIQEWVHNHTITKMNKKLHSVEVLVKHMIVN